MQIVSDPIDRRLLDEWQRDFPVADRPFAKLAQQLKISEDDVLQRLRRMQQNGRITRVGATCAPNTISASTLAAVAAPPERITEVAAIIGAEEGVNHSYLREDQWNLWFVVTGPDRAHVDAAIKRIECRSKLNVLDLRLVKPFNVDLGFRMNGTKSVPPKPRSVNLDALKSGDRALLQHLTQGLQITERPYADLAQSLNSSEKDVLARIEVLTDAGIVSRFGIIVRHRALGWSANAMVVWDMPSDRIDAAGPKLAAHSGVTLCYERRPVAGIWPYRLYSMIHARSRDEAMAVLTSARSLPEFEHVAHKVLFSTQCFKQTGALIAAKPERAA